MFPIELLPEAFQKQWCVAGGYAACPALSNDVDVWVYRVPTLQLDDTREQLLEHLNTVAHIENVPAHRSLQYHVIPGEETRTAESYCQEFIQIKKVAIVYGRRTYHDMKPVHVVVTDAQNPGVIITGFDISTHAVAIEWNGRVWKTGYTAPQERPRRLRIANEHTEPRMIRICERFGHIYFPKEDAIGETHD